MCKGNRLYTVWESREDMIFSENYKYLSMVKAFSAVGEKKREAPLSSRGLERILKQRVRGRGVPPSNVYFRKNICAQGGG